MENITLSLILLFATSVSGCHHFTSVRANDPAPAPSSCPDAIVLVEAQPEAPGQLSVAKARCEGFYWTAELTLKNVGNKSITGSEIVEVQDYENKKCDSSSRSENGFHLAPGESKVFQVGAGFTDGLSYGKPVGALKRNTFRISQLQFSDGTDWGQRWTGQ